MKRNYERIKTKLRQHSAYGGRLSTALTVQIICVEVALNYISLFPTSHSIEENKLRFVLSLNLTTAALSLLARKEPLLYYQTLACFCSV
jgi:hypothetical protein